MDASDVYKIMLLSLQKIKIQFKVTPKLFDLANQIIALHKELEKSLEEIALLTEKYENVSKEE